MNCPIHLERSPASTGLIDLRNRLVTLGLVAHVRAPGDADAHARGMISLADDEGNILCVKVPPGSRVRAFREELAKMRGEQLLALQHDAIIRDFGNKLLQSYEETNALFRIIRFMTTADDPLLQMQLLCNIVQQVMPFRWIAVGFRDELLVTPRLRGRLVLGGDTRALAMLTEPAREMLAQCRVESWTRVLDPNVHPLAMKAGTEVVHETIAHDGVGIGILLAGEKDVDNGEVGSPELLFLNALADFIGTYHENASRYSEQRAMSLGTLSALCAAIDAKDPYTRGHSERVAMLCFAIGQEMGFDAQAAERLRIAGLVHDVGKIGVPESVLCKSAKLSAEEFAMIRRHPEIGCRILEGVPLLDHVLPGVMHHHERFDGKGYPNGLAGEAIPLSARIIGLADAFDAMSSNRSYRPAMPRDVVLAELQRCVSLQFAPDALAAFNRVDLSAYDELLERQSRTIERSETSS